MTQFLYDGDELVAEYNGSGALLRRYVHGLGTDDPILWYEGAGLADRRSLQADHQGSIIGVANSAGASIAINAYDEWGVPNAGNTGRFQYTGQAWLPELGMYHYKARIYSPTLGRFLQTDPIGYEDQVNLYAYVGNDPVNLVDPSGMETCPDDPDDICVVAPDDSAKLSVVAAPGAETKKPQAPQKNDPPKRNPLNPKKDYCGSQGFDVPDGNWAEACKAHDDCYATVGAVKEVCDLKLIRDITAACSEKTLVPALCIIPGSIYGIGLMLFGIPNSVFQPSRDAYNEAQ